MNPLFSLLCPTRSRPQRFNDFLDSALANAANPESVEVDMVIDNDDELLPAYRGIGSQYINTRTVIMTERKPVPWLFHYLGMRARGRYIMLASDDMVFRTPQWDLRVQEAFMRYPDELVLVAPDDKCGNGKANFWWVSRRWVDVVGWFCLPDFEHFCADTVPELVARKANRFVRVDDVVCEHMHAKYGKAENDALYKSKRTRDAEGRSVSDRDVARMHAAAPEIEAAARRVLAVAAPDNLAQMQFDPRN